MRPAAAYLWIALAGLPAVSRAAELVDYVRDVQPLLKQHCYSCHSGLRQKSGLRVDHVTFLKEGGDRGSALAASGSESILIQAITGEGDVERMPLEAKPLAESEIATLRRWVDEGAKAPEEPLPSDPLEHWSYQPPRRAALPIVSAGWNSNPIDRFIAAEHHNRGLAPAPPAAKNVLLRRVYLDLIGLPPSPEELQTFLADESGDAYEKVVDRLLASPHYGERWGRHWMDVWRYSDWDGYGQEVRESQPHIWRWRDWIIESLNADRPYDDMLVQMLAADELAPLNQNEQRATGFLVRNWYKFNRNVWLENTVEHTAKAFLGTTLNCARCHDHMYDPILQTEYYAFRAFFEPHQVRTDRVPGQSNTTLDGLARVYDADAEKPTFLFLRGNEAQPDKEHPIASAVPRALRGEALQIAAMTLPPGEQYPGLRDYVQRESLDAAVSQADKGQTAMTAATTALADARKKLSDFLAAKAQPADAKPATAPAGNEQAPPPADAPSPEAGLNAAVSDAERAATLAEVEMLSAAANLVAMRAKIAADNAAFSVPPAADFVALAREANRAERVANSEAARVNVVRLEQEFVKAQAATDEAAKKKAGDLEKKLAEARKARDTAQTALGQPADTYTRFSPVYPNTSTGRRAALARWIASKSNPLTARVAINHIWLRHFGAPLVPTVFDFGLNGKPPTHSELLDWLAVELMDSGWRMKGLHRLIVTSAAYRQASTGAAVANRAVDPENLYLWRFNSRRMEAEAVRDSTLAVAESLDPNMFGPDLDETQGLDVARRSIYFRASKEKKVTFLDLFDRANVVDCYRRSETIVPQQALAMVNSSLTLTQARKLAEKLWQSLPADAPDRDAVFIAQAFERLLCRPATAEEASTCREFLAEQATRLADPARLTSFDPKAETKPFDAASRARENLVHVLLNHNDFVTIR